MLAVGGDFLTIVGGPFDARSSLSFLHRPWSVVRSGGGRGNLGARSRATRQRPGADTATAKPGRCTEPGTCAPQGARSGCPAAGDGTSLVDDAGPHAVDATDVWHRCAKLRRSNVDG